ncbi:hypothetical protein M438DRAFT_375534 [Aureobasidium pullulans EXF-150]|uniref:PH domain-containing protein n=1 Tax=Aureobasidium pullulans EXF-150 TaxID=1043002 RepID=A0A074XC99_AURPU|nr:uncharacterized protein M438DRAFT_375534 [Aureobasidium pullulans EXF-150]KEQ83048.1 hypothetical protein M438DRAFT_375534 [Aureobasidium pullulans EXF-150]
MSDVHNTTAAPADAPILAEPVVVKPAETIVDPVEEAAKPETAAVTETPAVAATEPTTTEAVATEAPAAVEEVPVAESAPAVEAAALAAEEKPATATAEESKAIESGVLGYKAPGLIKSLKFSKRTFWLGEEPVSVENLSTYLRGEKPETGNATAAWSSHTGKGLLYFVKHADEKKHPQGVLNLSEATDLEKATGHEFTFKIHHHKHAFKAANDAERDAWFVAVEKAMTEAKANKDTITSSESYKESLAGLVKSHTPHAAAGRKSMDASRPRATSSSSSSSSDAEAAAKKAKKSRSASRSGKRHSIFGGIMGKKAEHDAEKEEKKEEKAEEKAIEADKPATEAVEEPVAAETVAPLEAEAIAARVIDAPIEEAKVAEEKPVEPVAEVAATEVPANVEEVPVAESAALVEAAALAAEEKPLEAAVATEEKPIVNSVSSKPIEEKKKTEERPKTNKRSSLFGAFFDKVRSPATEKKESEVAPVVPAKETVVSAEPPVLAEPTTENFNLDPSAVETAAAPAVAEPVTEAPKEVELESNKVETPLLTPNTERKQSFFGSLAKKARSKSPAPGASTEAPAVPPKDDEVVAAAPVVEAPAATTEVAAEKPVEETIVPSTETKIETPKTATPKESRRKSYFGGFGGAKKEKTDVESPQEDKSMLGKVTGLFRTKSQAARPVKKENVAPTEPVPAIPATEAATTESTVVDTPAVAEPKVEESAVESAAPVTESQHTPANPTVSAAA